MYVYLYLCMHACMYLSMYVCIWMHACMHLSMHLHIHACMDICMYQCMHVWMLVSISAWRHACIIYTYANLCISVSMYACIAFISLALPFLCLGTKLEIYFFICEGQKISLHLLRNVYFFITNRYTRAEFET